jgi:hypothetical protein
LAIGHEQGAGFRTGEGEEAGEGPEEEHVGVAVGDLLARKEQGDVQELRPHGVGPPEGAGRRPRRQKGRQRLVRFRPVHESRVGQPLGQQVPVGAGEAAVVVEAQAQGLRRQAQEAPQAGQGYIDLGVAQEARHRPPRDLRGGRHAGRTAGQRNGGGILTWLQS